MKRLTAYALTAAAALATAGTIPSTANAAVHTYNFSAGGGKVIMVTGNNGMDFNHILNQIPGFHASPDCQPEFPGYPGEVFPDEAVGAVLKLVNEERAKAGLPALTLHAGATRAAQQRAREIEAAFSHTRPDGSNFTTALTAAGVIYRAAGENIAYGQKSAGQVMQDWMNSAGHRANIMNGNFTSIGIGHYKSAAGVDYWTQLFIN